MKEKNKYHECVICSPSISFFNFLDFMDHTNTHNDVKPYMCPECGSSFHQRSNYADHIHKYPNFHWYPCSECNLTFYTSEELMEHACQNLFLVPNIDTDSTICFNNVVPLTNKKSNKSPILTEQNNKFGHLYKCYLCTLSFKSLLRLKKHRREHFNNKFKCTKCLKTFKTSKLLLNHTKTHSKNKPSEYNCQSCNQVFSNFKSYKNHIEEFKGKHNFVCKKCDRWFSSITKLNKHECLILNNDEPFICSCLKTFSNNLLFKKHAGSRPYSCCKCRMIFDTITNLTRHIRTHTKQKPFICGYCGKGFTQSANLKNHETVHSDEDSAKCVFCSFTCKTHNGLSKHVKIKHTNPKPKDNANKKTDGNRVKSISCNICNKKFLFKRNLGMHLKVHEKKELLCPDCGKLFDSQSKLTIHYKISHGQLSVCKTCGKFFSSIISLNSHEKIHVSEKQFSCGICHKMFGVKNYLVQHMKRHNYDKPFSCTKCGKLFKVSVSLKYHSKICL